MRSDARKRLARANHNAPVRVTCERYSPTWSDWLARCDNTCASPLDWTGSEWRDAMEAALGHACLSHRRAS